LGKKACILKMFQGERKKKNPSLTEGGESTNPEKKEKSAPEKDPKGEGGGHRPTAGGEKDGLHLRTGPSWHLPFQEGE